MNGGSGGAPSDEQHILALNELLGISSGATQAAAAMGSNQDMAAFLVSAAGFESPTTASTAGFESPMMLSTVGITPAQSLQLADISGDAALAVAGLTGMPGLAEMPSLAAMRSSSSGAFESAGNFGSALYGPQLASMLGARPSFDQLPTSFDQSAASFEQLPASFDRAGTSFDQPATSFDDSLAQLLGKRKAPESDAAMPVPGGVRLGKRMTLPASFGGSGGGVGLQRVASHGADGAGPAQHQRKVAHNAIERRYRNNINDRIRDLRDAVPALQHVRPKKRASGASSDEESDAHVDGVEAATKLNKATVLGKAAEYIYHLRRAADRMRRESAYLQEFVRTLPDGDRIVLALLQKAAEDSAAATAALRLPERALQPRKRRAKD
ncbi:hypothetical protein IWW51_002242 [Coemansia sp. RSA 2702]|nr:hypothetical protein IWW51_002242 [Coemansia sp. RSA 2702]